jgi:hypothetical protein
MNTLYHLIRADFLERVRRYNFLLVLALTGYLGFAINRGDFYLELDGYRGVLNSAWAGGMMAASATLMLSLFGFYLVNNSIQRDIETRVGQIIATTPLTRPQYLLGKWLSNTAVLLALLVLLAAAAVVMQLLGGESARLEAWQLLAPFLLLALPAMIVVAALAVFMETLPWLRGGPGNVIYFFVWIFAMVFALESKVIWFDWSGILIVWQSMGAALARVYPDYSGGFNFTEQALPEGGLQTFLWSGIQWNAQILLSRLAWLAGAAGLVFAGSLFFHRFDPSREKIKTSKKSAPDQTDGFQEQPSASGAPAATPVHLGALEPASFRYGFLPVLAMELRLLLKGQPWWWYAGGAGIILAAFFNPLDVVRQGLLPAAWIWPVLVWSGLGCRETRHATRQIVFSAARPLTNQLPAAWLAGLLVTALAGSGAAVRLLAAGEWSGLAGWLGGALFIPSLALALGTWTGSGKTFEVIYVLWWYLGPLHPAEMPALDFMGITAADHWPVYILLGAALSALSLIGRWRQTRG